jgi:hypothetical protein
MASPEGHIPKRPSSQKLSSTATPPYKRLCVPTTADSSRPSVQQLLDLSNEDVYSLPKQALRDAFLNLREYALNPYPILHPSAITPDPATSSNSSSSSSSSSSTAPADLPPLLRLPRELREMIYQQLLSPPSRTPIRGPHPRQLQTHITLSQSFPPALLRLNRQIRAEALPVVYGSAEQTVHVVVDYNVWAHKTRRSDLVLSPEVPAAIRHLDVSIHLGAEKRTSRPGDVEADARITEVRKGLRKLGKWLNAADVQTLRVGWQEPPQTFTWEQKREVLDGLKALRTARVEVGEINWGLNWNKGRRFRFEIDYFKELERDRQDEVAAAAEAAGPPAE